MNIENTKTLVECWRATETRIKDSFSLESLITTRTISNRNNRGLSYKTEKGLLVKHTYTSENLNSIA